MPFSAWSLNVDFFTKSRKYENFSYNLPFFVRFYNQISVLYFILTKPRFLLVIYPEILVRFTPKNSRFLVREFFVLHEDFSYFAHFKRFLRHFGAFFAVFAPINDFIFCLLCSAKHTPLRIFLVKLFVGKPTFFYYFYARHAFFACLISLPT